MPDLSHLKIDSAPGAFAEFCRKHNQLVDLIGSIQGVQGVDIKVTHTPAKTLSVPGTPSGVSKQPKGRITVGFKPPQTGPIPVGSPGGSSTATELHYNSNGIAIDIDGTNGVLLTQLSTGYASRFNPDGTFQVIGNGNSVDIDPALISHHMTVRTINVCNANVTQSMLIIASAPF